MNCVSIRMITDDVARLVTFYEQVTRVAARWATPDFAELVTPSCTLALASSRTLALFGDDCARPAANHSVIVEFRVDDADAEYQRVSSLDCAVVQAPTTMPWGNRSLLFRDPDGNLVNFFTPVTEEALRRQER
ncbi:VOC family protein [Streptomyces reniochalinae]|uniref:VOC family protein n=1 Tax=Streptomyces reniochalinae TaxID=2250578 RepID=A0A367ECF3_9ACTN|nr:VOC family protein [Streptomyces reniochalinae]RCG15027.1 VOC family protein [Streptomyces reniochalinae]